MQNISYNTTYSRLYIHFISGIISFRRIVSTATVQCPVLSTVPLHEQRYFEKLGVLEKIEWLLQNSKKQKGTRYRIAIAIMFWEEKVDS